MEKLVYTTAEACQVAQISIPTLRQWTRTPGFPVLRAGTKVLIPIEPFKRWMAEQAQTRNA